MKAQEYLDIFAADEPVAILTALYELGGEVDVAPADTVLAQATGYFTHADPDLRHRAYRSAFPKLLEILETEQAN